MDTLFAHSAHPYELNTLLMFDAYGGEGTRADGDAPRRLSPKTQRGSSGIGVNRESIFNVNKSNRNRDR